MKNKQCRELSAAKRAFANKPPPAPEERLTHRYSLCGVPCSPPVAEDVQFRKEGNRDPSFLPRRKTHPHAFKRLTTVPITHKQTDRLAQRCEERLGGSFAVMVLKHPLHRVLTRTPPSTVKREKMKKKVTVRKIH